MIYYTVLIYIHESEERTYLEYEDLTLPILEDYNGELVYRLKTNSAQSDSSEDFPYEVHLLRFENQSDFDAYLKDERRVKATHLKEQSIKKTVLVKGNKV